MADVRKYSPKWFKYEGEKKEYVDFDIQTNEIRQHFLDKFDIRKLETLKGKELLSTIFIDGTSSKESLCHVLEFDRSMRLFGGITGGSAFKFGLFFYKKEQKWVSGTNPKKYKCLNEEQAVSIGSKIRDQIVKGAKIIQSRIPLTKIENYIELYESLSDIPIRNDIWVMKYYQMLFPEVFVPFYSQEIQNSVLKLIGEKPDENPYVRMGQIKLFINRCDISNTVFAEIYYKEKNNGKESETNLSDNNKITEIGGISSSIDLGIRGIHYWLYSPGTNGQHWDYIYRNGLIGIGWENLGDLNKFSSQNEIKRLLSESGGSNKNNSLALWEFRNSMRKGDVVYAKNGRKKILGKGIVDSEYYYDENNKIFRHLRKIKWISNQENSSPWTFPVKTLTDITRYTDDVKSLEDLYFLEDEVIQEEGNQDNKEFPSYKKEDFLSDVYMTSETYEKLRNLYKIQKKYYYPRCAWRWKNLCCQEACLFYYWL